MDSFGNRLRAVRNEKNMTLDKLATDCGTSMTVIRNYEKSRKSPNVEMLLRICNVLKVSPDYLLQDDLSFNPFEENGKLVQLVNTLTPTQISLVKDFIESLQRHASED